MSHSRYSNSNQRRRSRSPPHRRIEDFTRRSNDDRPYKRDDYGRDRRGDRHGDEYNRRDDYTKRHYEERRNDRYSQDYHHEPNITVVLRNLPDHAREVDIQSKLNSMKASIDDVALIKDRDTGDSRKFAFIRFTSVGHAIQFVDQYKSFDWDSYRVRVDYCKKNKQDVDGVEEWRCRKCGIFNVMNRRTCIECKQSHFAVVTETIEINDGTKDISTAPTHLLLLRKLDHLSTEESIFNAVHSLQGVYRALLIRDKMTKMSCEFAFVEFYNVQYASMALEYASELLKIDGRKVSVSYGNQESFIPVYGQSEWSISAYEGLVAYWDKSSFASEYSLEQQQKKKKEEEEEEEEERIKEEVKKKKETKKDTLDDDLSAFYKEMGGFTATTTDASDIFTVPKAQ